MAIYHLHVQIIQRSQGKNAIAASSYRRAAKLYNKREGKFYDFRNKPNVIHSELLVPKDAPSWVQELVALHKAHPSAAVEQLWNQCEATEKRVDAQLVRELEFALPIELHEAQAIQLAHAFIHDQFVLRGMMADWSVHWDKGNPHVHVLLTMRSLTEQGFGHKIRAWDSKALLQTWREQWAEYANFHLRLHQHNARIDHRSYAEQGIDLIPGIHEGNASRAMAKRGIGISRLEEAEHIRALNLSRLSENAEILFHQLSTLSDTFIHQDISQILGRYVQPKTPAVAQPDVTVDTASLSHPFFANATPGAISLENELKNASVLTPKSIEAILDSISQHESVFTEKDITKAVENLIKQADQFAQAIITIKQSPTVIALGPGEDGRDRFTTRRLFDIENDIQQLADKLRERGHLSLAERQQNRLFMQHQQQTGQSLTEEQQAAVFHLLKPTAVSCLVGRAGTGKSFCLGTAKALWEAQGVTVHGIALSGIAADGLSKDVGIPSNTIESFKYRVKQGSLIVNPWDVIVMDEAGMTDSVSMQAVFNIAEQANAKLVLVGDPAQLQPVGPGASFRALLERVGFAEIQTVYRQTIPWQREATGHFSTGEMTQGLSAYQAAGCLHLKASPDEAIAQLMAHWNMLLHDQQVPLDRLLVITYRNEDVNTLNQRLRTEQVNAGKISEGYTVQSKQGQIKLASGDRLLFLKNDSRLGIKNGRFATVKAVDFMESGQATQFTVKLDGSGDMVSINPQDYTDFTYGYAATVHKTQSATMDHCLVYAGGKGWHRGLTYVALTRHRQSCHLYADQATHINAQTLIRRLSRWQLKDSVLDFPLAFAERRGIDPEALPQPLSARLARWTKQLAAQIDGWLRPEAVLTRQAEQARQQQKIEQVTQRREDARVVAAYVDARREVGKTWQAVQAKLAIWGLATLPYQDTYVREVIQGTADYRAFQTAQRLRDRTANEILQAPARYEKALAIHEVDCEQLEKHAARHQSYLRVQQYTRHLQSGFDVYRDYFALHISRAITSHYSFLQEAGFNTTEHRRQLRTHALSYLRRQCFLTLTAQEQDGFALVEAYQAAAKQAGTYWLTDIKPVKAPAPDAYLHLNQLGQFRDTLADAILKQVDDCQKALDFYQIGRATPPFGETPSLEQHCHAQKRWYQLQQQAAYHVARERVAAYQTALEKSDVRQRFLLAYDILQDTKAHHGAIIGLGGDTKAIWRSIRQDAQHQTDLQFYRTLDAVDRLAFRDVKHYVEVKKAYSDIWREFFQQQKVKTAVGEEHIAPDAHVSLAAMRYSKMRNELAAKLLGHPVLYQSGLAYFGIQPEELDAAAYRHQCYLNVEQYSRATSRLARAEQALTLIADPKAHALFIREQPLDWKMIYRDARIAERRQYFTTLNPLEKSHYRLAHRYRKANQAVGKQYAAYQAAQAKPPLPAKLAYAFARRDRLAWQLVNAWYEADPAQLTAFAEPHKLSVPKLLQQHARQTEKLAIVEQYQTSYQAAIAAVQAVYHAEENQPNRLAGQIHTALTHINATIQIHLFHKFDQSRAWQATLALYGLSAQPVAEQIKGLNTLKSALQSLALHQNIAIKPVQPQAITTVARLSQPVPRIDAERLRAALNEQVEAVATHYLGEPKARQGYSWRYGRNQGSLVVTVQGAKQGLWRDFQLDKGGDMLGLIQHTMETYDFKAILQEATRFLGGESFYQTAAFTPAIPLARKVTDADAYTQQRIQKAQAIYQGTQCIAGTLAERYLREHRGILGKLAAHTLRYHPQLRNWMTGSIHPALVVVARDKRDEVCGVQAIFLDEKTAKKATQLAHQVKLSRGLIGEGAMVHQGKPDGKIALAEGIETALSIAETQPDWTVYVTFGVSNLAKTRLPETAKSVLIGADNDGQDSATRKSVAKSAEKLAQRGIDVWVAEPQKPEHQAKWDFNDALLADGIQQIKQDLAAATLYQKGTSQATITADLKETLTALGESTKVVKTSTLSQTFSWPELHPDSLNTLLTRYVEMELEQTRRVNAMHTARLKDPKVGKAASRDALAHADKIQAFATQAIEHPEIKTLLESKPHIKPPHLAERGGFISIYERLQQGEWLEADTHLLAKQLRNKAGSEARAQARERSQEGRGR